MLLVCVARSKIYWELPKTINLHEEAYGSCTIIGSSVTSNNLMYTEQCKYQHTVTIIDQYTVRVNFTIYNTTGLCQVTCLSTDYAETRRLHVTNTVNSDTSYTSTNELTPMITPTLTRTNDKATSTQSLTYTIISSDIQLIVTTGILNTTGISQVDTIDTGGDTNSNSDMIIALILLVMILLIVTTLNLMLTIKNQRNEESKC